MKKTYSKELTKLLNKKVLNGELLGLIYVDEKKLNRIELDLTNLRLRFIDGQNKSEYEISKINRIYIRSYIKKYNMAAWSNLPMGDLFALDAPTKTITLIYDNTKVGGTYLDTNIINLYSRIPKDGHDYIDKLLEYIMSLKKEKKLIK